jgi:hypothetical protein
MRAKIVWTVLFVAVCLSTSALQAADDFTVCKGTFALCTTAKCTPVPGKEGTVSCGCEVKTGYSAGHESCEKAKEVGAGQLMSRYYPVKYHVNCSNSRPWATCLDKPCTVDKDNPSKATCACSLVQNQGDYVVVTSKYETSTCTTGIVSSATVQQSEQITDFLKTQPDLPPFPIQVMNPTK